MKIKKQTMVFKNRMSKKKQNLMNYLPPQPLKYYKELPFMPGLDFYRALGDTTFNLNHLGTFIPDTMISMGKLTWIQWEPGPDPYSGSNTRRDNNFVLLNFAEHLKSLEISIYNRSPGESDKPVVIEKKLADSYLSITERTLNWTSLTNILNTAVSVNSIIQKFSSSRSKKSCILRICYNSTTSAKAHKNKGVMIANKDGYIINEFDETSYEIFTLKGKIIYEYEKRTQKIMAVLERVFNIRMKQIVCDFQKDDKNFVWLIGIHSYLVETHQIYKPMIKASEEVVDSGNTKIFGTKRCKMCRLKYSQDQINKLITTKMMYELKSHLYKRGIF